jgi:hypothetical protein
MRPLVATTSLLGLVLAVAGCGAREDLPPVNPNATPACVPQEKQFNSTVVLMAQAVPSASQLPCIRGLPVGWQLTGLKVQAGLAEFSLTSDREGDEALRVEVTRECEVGGATKIPSPNPQILRYERVTRVTNGYGGQRHFVYPGGCTTYTFDLQGESQAQALAAVTQALDFVDRETVAQQVNEWSDGRIQLDPPKL